MKNIIVMIGIAVIMIVGLYVVKILDISYPLTIVNTSRSSELSVVGEGKIDVTPDTAFVDAGISINNEGTVEAVQKKMDEINNMIVKGLRGLGIEKADIKTSNYSINPNYNYDGRESRITGYNGNVTISVKVKNTALVSKVVEEVTKDGANQVNGVRFSVENPAQFREEARDKAIQNAKEQAEKLAKSLGIKLGKITNVVESNQGNQPMYLYDASMKSGAGGGGGPQIEPGNQTITSVVTLYFEKK